MTFKQWQELRELQSKAHRAARFVFLVLLSLIIFALLAIKYGNAQTQIAPFITPSATIYQTLSANVNGEIFPAECGSNNKPSWCSGTTAGAWITAACGQLPAAGGVVNLLGLNGTIAASVTCSTTTKQVIMLTDPTSTLTITETDGGVTFPLDDGSMLLGPGAGQCNANQGIHLTAGANITAIVGNAHTDGTQENFTADGNCIYGKTGATVSQGLVMANRVYANTEIDGNVIGVCNAACVKVLNTGEIDLVNNWLNVEDGVPTITGSPLVIQALGLPEGCDVGPVNVSGGQIEHAVGGTPEIDIKGDGTGSLLACDIHIHDVGIERTPAGTASSIGISIADCWNCSVENVIASGISSGSSAMIGISSNALNSVSNVVLRNIGNTFGSYVNTLNDTTASGIVIPYASQKFITTYYSNPGYVQPPVLPPNTLESLGTDVMSGAGSFATGSGTLPTGFTETGCLTDQGLTCTYTRTNSTAPPGFTYSQEVNISANTDPSAGDNGLLYSTPISFTAGQTYVATFWAKGDGTFQGQASFLLWHPTTPSAIYCVGVAPAVLTTTWTAYTFNCTPTSSGSSYLSAVAATPIGATGTFWIGGFTFAPISPLTPGSLLTALAPYGIGSATDAQQTITINGVPCELGGSCSAGGGVPSVNTLAQPLVLSFSAGAGSCSTSGGTQTCTFTGTSTGTGTVTNFIASSGAWPSWLVPSVATSTTTPTLSVSASAIPNSALANSTFTLGSTSVTLGTTVTSISGLTLASPTFSGGAFGTPASLTLTNATGLPWSGLAGSPSTSQVPFQTLTTTGTSGPATLSGGTLNIPQYVPSGGTTVTICSGTISLGTASIPSGSAASTVTATCSGLTSADNIELDFNGSPLAVTGFIPGTSGTLTIFKWPTSNTINVSVVNNTGSAVVPGAITLNYRVVR